MINPLSKYQVAEELQTDINYAGLEPQEIYRIHVKEKSVAEEIIGNMVFLHGPTAEITAGDGFTTGEYVGYGFVEGDGISVKEYRPITTPEDALNELKRMAR